MDVFPKPDVILTHESDLDGLVSGILLRRLARKLFGIDVRIEAYHYNNWKLRDLRESSAWVSDFTFEKRMDKANWLIIDHHTTDVRPTQSQFVHDVNKSAGLLCYELCKEHGLGSPELDRLVEINNVADLFLEDHPDFILANDYSNLVKSYQFWNLYSLIDGSLERLLNHPLLEVMAVKRRVEDPLGIEWSRKNISELSPTVGYVDTVVGNINMVVHHLLESHATRYPVLVTLFRRGNTGVVVSLRSRNGEALKIAERLQGGGHPNACGATLPRSVKTIQDAVLYLRQALNPNVKHEAPLNNLENLFASIEIKD
jgi:oligoribonuclease NrnB/cAMP/cGMP phosphodiesterase (DHH superfamily)